MELTTQIPNSVARIRLNILQYSFHFIEWRWSLSFKLLLANNRRTLFNVSPLLDHALDKSPFEATVKSGTQLCSRRLLQPIIYCAGGVSVFFPLFTRIDLYEVDSQQLGHTLLTPITKERLTVEIVELIASVLDENLPNQQQMLNLSGFLVLGLAEVLLKDAISHVFLNPFIWVYAGYKVQRELYMFLIPQFDNDPRLLRNLCRFPRMPFLEHIAVSDIESLVSFLETSQDMTCIEDILHMIIRALSQKSLPIPTSH
ncbi:BEACH domain-containing protein B isoform X1 [Tanacetum coccineum]